MSARKAHSVWLDLNGALIKTYRALHRGALPKNITQMVTLQEDLARILEGKLPSGWVAYWVGRSVGTGGVCIKAPRHSNLGVVWRIDPQAPLRVQLALQQQFPPGSVVRARAGDFEALVRNPRPASDSSKPREPAWRMIFRAPPRVLALVLPPEKAHHFVPPLRAAA